MFPVERVVLLLMAIVASVLLRAQSEQYPQRTTYRFEMEGIHSPDLAKPVQIQLLQLSDVILCTFIDECDCFKLETSAPKERAELQAMLEVAGTRLSGDVHASDGRVLPAIETPSGQ